MTRLPTVGSDDGKWGSLLNTFLNVGHNTNGTLKGVQTAFNVKDYGAVGDGVADDSSAFSRAISSIPSTGGLLYVPSGIYKVSGIVFSSRSDVCTLGEGTSSVIAPTEGNTAITYSGCTRCHLGMLRIDGSLNGGTIGISITGNFDAKIFNVHINDLVGDGIYVNGDGLGGSGTEIELSNVTCRNNGGYGYHYTRTTNNDTGGMYLRNFRTLYNTRGAGGVKIESRNVAGTPVFHSCVDLVSDNYLTPAILLHNVAHCRFTRLWAGGSTNSGMVTVNGKSYMIEIDGAYIVNGNNQGSNLLIDGSTSNVMLDNLDFDGSPASHVHVANSGCANIFFGQYQVFGSSPFTDTLPNLFRRSAYMMQLGPAMFETDGSGGYSTSIGIDDIGNPGKQKWIRNCNGVLQIFNTAFSASLLELQDNGQFRWNNGTWITRHLSGTNSWTPGTVPVGGQVHGTVTINGVAVGDTVNVGFSFAIPTGMIISGAVTSPNIITVTLFNASGVPQTLGAGKLRADVWQH